MVFNFDGVRDSVELSRILLKYRDELATRLDILGGINMMRAYSDLTDALIKRILEYAIECAESTVPSIRTKALRNLAVAAVGGYGRREMSPFSDVDVAFIVNPDEDDDIDLVVKRAFRILMDVLDHAGLKVGYSYRKADEVEDLPLDTQTALVDARCIAGSNVVFNGFRAALRSAIIPAAFVTGHINSRNNLGYLQDTPFVVEPDIKEGRGGLRDLHAARWIAQVTFGLSQDNVWAGLRAKGILLDKEIEEIEAATEFVTRTRNILHLLAGRGLDTLSVERQDQVAAKMGFTGVKEFTSRYFIWNYFSHAHQIWRIFRKISSACIEYDLEIEPGVVARDGRLYILDKGLLSRDNSAFVRIFRDARSFDLELNSRACIFSHSK